MLARDEEILGDVIFTAAEIRRRVRELGRRITRDYQANEVQLVTVLKGGVFFLADLARAIRCPVSLDFLAISSYAGGSQSGEVRLTKDLDESIVGRHVLIVEDVVDTGLTLGYIRRVLEQRRPASLRICILFDRPYRRLVDLPIDYVGFELPDLFVVGYGLDYRQRYRNLPEVRAVKPEALALPER
ncbi:MAG: hypoxanthine phosphoribosyltransferase [Armatimonadetes bacterium]|nr:hypoxanthine phosphoribosyltransferase [Armatimonadota bacterium]